MLRTNTFRWLIFLSQYVFVGPVPQNICDHFRKFLSLPKTSIRARVLGKRVNRGADCGLEIRVRFIFQGHVKGIA